MPVALDSLSPSPTTVDIPVCSAGPDRISLEEVPVAEDEEADGVPDPVTVLSDVPVTVEETTRAPVPLLVRSVIEVTTLDCVWRSPFAVANGLDRSSYCYSLFILGKDLQYVEPVINLDDLRLNCVKATGDVEGLL